MLALIEAFEDLGNPFIDDSGNLIDLDESLIMNQDVVDNVNRVNEIGLTRYKDFIDKRIMSQEESFNTPIKLTKLKLFKTSLSRTQKKSPVAAVKQQHEKATQLLLAIHSGREINESVFSHETSTFPPSLTRKGHMHLGTKSEIVDCFVPKDLEINRPRTTTAVLDGAVLVHMLRPGSAITIGNYFTDVFAPYVMSWFETNNRVDVVWDVYSKTSLKSGTREQRGMGARRRVTLATKTPSNWAAFLRVNLNKQELFVELAKSLKLLSLPQVLLQIMFYILISLCIIYCQTAIFCGEFAILLSLFCRIRSFTPLCLMIV